MKETPIIFSTAMVRAILDGKKTQTRRVVRLKRHPTDHEWHAPFYAKNKWCFSAGFGLAHKSQTIECPHGKPGDRLWVRETWAYGNNVRPRVKDEVIYKADDRWCVLKWKPSIHMFKKYARIWLEIVNVRVEKLRDIGIEDVHAEGIERWRDYEGGTHLSAVTTRNDFQRLWDSINGKKHPWSENPWVWMIEFKRISLNGDITA